MARPLTASDEEILDVAQDILVREGLSGFSISAVARRIGLSRTAISLRFQNIDNLRRVTMERMSRGFEEKLTALDIQPGGEGLLAVADVVGGHIRSREGFSGYMARTSLGSPDAGERGKHLQRGNALRQAIARAMPDTEVEHSIAVDMFLSHIAGSLLQWREAQNISPREFLRERTLIWLRLTHIPIKAE